MDLLADIEEVNQFHALKSQGRFLLKTNRVAEAIRIYAHILQNYPDDLDALLILGDGYLIAGEVSTALYLYKKAYDLYPERRDIKRRIEILSQKHDSDKQIKITSSNYQVEVERLIHKLTGGKSSVNHEDLIKAQEILETFIQTPTPSQAVMEHLSEIDHLMPAFIELNIRQAQEEGRLDLVDSLQMLLSNLLLQRDISSFVNPSAPSDAHEEKREDISVLITGNDSSDCPNRGMMIYQMLHDDQIKVDKVDRSSGFELWTQYDVVIARNPQSDEQLMKCIALRAANQKPLIVDLDQDYGELSSDHPDFDVLGPGRSCNLRSYHSLLYLADQITVPTRQLALRLKEKGVNASWMPEAWSQYNPLWLKPATAKTTVNLGLFGGLPTQIEDFNSIKRMVLRVMREVPSVRVVVYGDIEIYRLFDGVMDNRKLFLPNVDANDYPYLFSQVDILLNPIREVPANRYRTDRLLMEAGVRRIPWVSFPHETVLNWGKGGLLADSPETWYGQIVRLITDLPLREKLGQEGYQHSLSREFSVIRRQWIEQFRRLKKNLK